MRRIISVIFAAVFLLRTAAADVYAAAEPAVHAQTAALIDAVTGEILYGRGEDRRMQPASMTKIMTALVVLDTLPLDLPVTVTPSAVGIEGSSAQLEAGEVFSVEELLYALLLQSANDAAAALAEACGGADTFVSMMNDTAERLGLSGTHFANPHGLPDADHYSTAADIAALLCRCMENDDFARICGTRQYVIRPGENRRGRCFTNHNRLLSEIDGVTGGKTGYTSSSGRCLCSFYDRDGVKLCAVTMNDPDDWNDHRRLYEYGSSLYREVIIDVDRTFTLHVVGGLTDAAECTVKERKKLMVRADGTPEMTLYMRRFEYAPVAAGEQIGEAVWQIGGRTVYRIKLYADNKVEAYNNSPGDFFRWRK